MAPATALVAVLAPRVLTRVPEAGQSHPPSGAAVPLLAEAPRDERVGPSVAAGQKAAWLRRPRAASPDAPASASPAEAVSRVPAGLVAPTVAVMRPEAPATE